MSVTIIYAYFSDPKCTKWMRTFHWIRWIVDHILKEEPCCFCKMHGIKHLEIKKKCIGHLSFGFLKKLPSWVFFWLVIFEYLLQTEFNTTVTLNYRYWWNNLYNMYFYFNNTISLFFLIYFQITHRYLS